MIMRRATTHADKRSACDLVRAAFQVERPAIANQAMRLASALRATGDWWLLEAEGRPACTLVCYPLQLGTPEGDVVPGFGIGAVATRPDAQRRGHAAELCAHVAERAEAAGRPLGLLFSAIPPAYYERLGYRACPAWDHVCTRPAELAESGVATELLPFDPRAALPELQRVYAHAHAGRLHLHRDAAGWERSLAVSPADWWLGIGDPDGDLRGYARLDLEARSVDLLELVLTDPEDEAPALRALARMAVELDRTELGCWLPPSPTVSAWFEDRGRAKTLPMVRGSDSTEGSQFWGSDYF